jgi:phosphatidyl-myo-inositol dimannoside synthase
LQALARKSGVEDRVRFIGDVEDDQLPACYAAADLFLLPTREIPTEDEVEGFGIAYVEAAASGVPSIATDAGGVADAVSDGVTGLLVAQGSAAAVAAAAVRLLSDPALRARLGRDGRLAVERHLNWDRAAAEVMVIVEAAAVASRPRFALSPTPVGTVP